MVKFETRICCKRCKNVVSSLFPFLGIQVAFPTEVNAEEKSTVTGHKVSDLLQQFCGPNFWKVVMHIFVNAVTQRSVL